MHMAIPHSSTSSDYSGLSDYTESQSSQSVELCQVCGLGARGKHFGALTCRACAAFFRRADAATTNVKPCKKEKKCELLNKNGWFDCKACRLQKCYDVGMTSTNFQFDRDPISTKLKNDPIVKSLENFLGRPHCVIFVEPGTVTMKKDMIDCSELINKASKLMIQGAEAPLHSDNSLLQMAMALRRIDEKHGDGIKMVTKYGKEEILSFFENDFLKATQWFCYFDEFRGLEEKQKITMMEAMWHVWTRLYKLSTAAVGKRRQVCDQEHLMISHDSEYTVMNVKKIEFDYSWCTKYSNEQMQHFLDNTENSFLYKLIDMMVELKPNDVEMAYMMCQACFQYAGQRFQGTTLEFCDTMQQKLGDELHEYYVGELNMANYSRRLCQLLKINSRIKEDIWKCRSKQEIAEVFDIYSIEYSHPEIFKDV